MSAPNPLLVAADLLDPPDRSVEAEEEHREKVRWWREQPGYWLCDRDVCDGKPHDRWTANHARKLGEGRSQAPPPGPWRTMYSSGGRGSGKDWSGSHILADLILDYWFGDGDWAVVGPTFGDARDVCMIGPSGLIRALGGRAGPHGSLVATGPWIAEGGWNVSTGQLFLRNGAIVFSDGADDGALRIQGKNLRGVHASDVGLWKNWKDSWDESIKYAVRLPPAKRIVNGTPKANRGSRVLVRQLLDDPKVPVMRLRTEENVDNLDPDQLAEWLAAKGTRLGRQELEGELLTDREGALVTWDDIVPHRVYENDLPEMRRVLVSVDPSFSNTEDADECGIVGVGEGVNGHGYILADWSGRYSLDVWAKRAVLLAWLLGASAIVYEANLVGQVVLRQLEAAVSDLLTNPDAWLAPEMAEMGVEAKPDGWLPPRLKPCTSRMPKDARLEVVAPLWQQHRVHHVILDDGAGGEILQDRLEHQLTEWTPEDKKSPDRMDAAVQGISELGLQVPRRPTRPVGQLQSKVHATAV